MGAERSCYALEHRFEILWLDYPGSRDWDRAVPSGDPALACPLGRDGRGSADGSPGDAIVTGEVSQTTRSITVHTRPAQIWPWLLQLGQGRGGMYSYDFLENLAGCDIHTLNTIVPALQNLQVGDPIFMGPQEGLPYYQVVLLEPQKALVLQSINRTSGAPGETWGFYLIEQSSSLTRLVSATAPHPAWTPNRWSTGSLTRSSSSWSTGCCMASATMPKK
jgi:hypothetical protein